MIPMSVNAISNELGLAKSAAGIPQQASGLAAASEEATETLATTRKEAQNGDRVAQRKLEQLQANQQQAAEQKASEPGKGNFVDKDA
jgi:hypothetical protein